MAISGTYPGTAQAMLDRLLTDRTFRIRTIVADNYPAVKAKYDQHFGNGTYESTPERLTTAILASNESDEIIDQILDVPFRNIAGSTVLRDAMAQGEQMIRESGVGASKSFLTGFTASIGGIVTGLGNIVNGRYIADANARVQSEAIVAQSVLDQQRTEQRERIIRMSLIATVIVVVVALLIIYRPK